MIFFLFPPAPSDYTALNNLLVFNDANRSQTLTVTIQDDNVVEQQFENFVMSLCVFDPTVILSPVTANVIIEDDDSKLTHSVSYSIQWLCTYICMYVNCHTIILFSISVVTIGINGTYSLHEDATSITITVLVLMNSLARDVSVTLSTSDGTAMGEVFEQ